MNVIKLDRLQDQDSMLIFHVLARLGYEGLVIVSPQTPLASVGYFQDAQKEIDLEYCKKAGISVMRREVGGGATYLDGNQIFYQMIWHKSNDRFPTNIKKIFELMSQPPVNTYRRIGIEASFREENDIITDAGKKIAGEGGGDIADSMVFVGGILLDFDYVTMSRVLKVPDEKFRDKIYKSMEENLTTIKRELGTIPPREDIRRILIEEFERLTGNLEPVELDTATIKKMRELQSQFMSDEFLFKKTPRIPEGVTIKQGIDILYGLYKARGGLIRTAEEVENKKTLKDIVVSGDFNLFPKHALQELEKALKNKDFDRATVLSAIEKIYTEHQIQSPGVDPTDITKTVIEAKK
ncbi:MAG: lipoate--protein ligase family protein [candidate division WOR-3 bacterium]|nr:MAG: lipoate--protein ligase family protein [candidate division WOR-3 bacterium]